MYGHGMAPLKHSGIGVCMGICMYGHSMATVCMGMYMYGHGMATVCMGMYMYGHSMAPRCRMQGIGKRWGMMRCSKDASIHRIVIKHNCTCALPTLYPKT